MQKKNKLVLIELQYAAPIPYYILYKMADAFRIEQHEHYIKRSFRNRCTIATSNGAQNLSIPLKKGKHQQKPIREVLIDNGTAWQIQHWRSLKTAYGNAPFWEDYAPFFEPFYQKEYTFLFDFCLAMHQQITQLLYLPTTKLTYSASYQHQVNKDEVLDMRNKISPRYVKEHTSSPNHVVYPQVFSDRCGFLPNLSILDLLFCTGPEASIYLNQTNALQHIIS